MDAAEVAGTLTEHAAARRDYCLRCNQETLRMISEAGLPADAYIYSAAQFAAELRRLWVLEQSSLLSDSSAETLAERAAASDLLVDTLRMLKPSLCYPYMLAVEPLVASWGVVDEHVRRLWAMRRHGRRHVGHLDPAVVVVRADALSAWCCV